MKLHRDPLLRFVVTPPPLLSAGEQSRRFNDTTGAHGYWTKDGPTGAHQHPDKCVCQGTDPTPHKHYDEAPFACARCGKCDHYRPEWP